MNLIKYILFSCFSICLFTSCGTTFNNAKNADNNIQKLELGMTKIEVIAIMGKTYKKARSQTNSKRLSGNARI